MLGIRIFRLIPQGTGTFATSFTLLVTAFVV